MGKNTVFQESRCDGAEGSDELEAAAVCQANRSATVRAVTIAIIIISMIVLKGRRSLEIKSPW